MSASVPHNEEAHSAMHTAYGLFLLAWGEFETILEVAIARQLARLIHHGPAARLADVA